MHECAFLIDLFNSRRNERVGVIPYESEFNPRDLIGRTLERVRDFPTLGYENPSFIRSFDFKDGSSLVIGFYGDGECSYGHCFLVEPDGRDRYCSCLSLFDAHRPLQHRY